MKLLQKIKMHPAVESIEDEGRGRGVWGHSGPETNFWCYLKEGWQTPNEETSVHEPTLKDIWDALQSVENHG